MLPVGQIMAHCPQPMQPMNMRVAMLTLPPSMARVRDAQTSTHRPQPVQDSSWTVGIALS